MAVATDVEVCFTQAQVVKILIQTERGVYFCFEQPAQSYAFKQSSILAVKALASMCPGMDQRCWKNLRDDGCVVYFSDLFYRIGVVL